MFKPSMRKYTTFMLCCTVFCLFADQNLLAPNLSQIAKDFGFSDAERDEKLGGYIALCYFIVGGPVAILVGYCTDIMNRCLLFGVVVAFGESACLGTYFVQTYPQLLLCRALTGISMGGATPIIYSILGDLYPGKRRVYVSTVIGISMTAGITAGQLISGIIGPIYGWRVPFLIIAIPALLCALLVFFTVKEPIRGDQEQEIINIRKQSTYIEKVNYQYEDKSISNIELLPNNTVLDTTKTTSLSFKEQYINTDTVNKDNSTVTKTNFNKETEKLIPRIDTNLESNSNEIELNDIVSTDYNEKIECSKIFTLLMTPSAILIYLQGIPGCLPWGMIYVFLNDYFSEDRGLSIQLATLALTCFGIGGILGQLLGGWIGQKLYNIYPPYQCILMGSSTITSICPMLYLLNTNNLPSTMFYLIAFMAGFTTSMNGPNIRAVLQNVCIPEIRGTAFAIFTLTDDIGKGLGPEAFNSVVMCWLLSGMLLLFLSKFVLRDERIVQETIRKSLYRSIPVST